MRLLLFRVRRGEVHEQRRKLSDGEHGRQVDLGGRARTSGLALGRTGSVRLIDALGRRPCATPRIAGARCVIVLAIDRRDSLTSLGVLGVAGDNPFIGNPRFDLIAKRRHAIHQKHRVVHAGSCGRLGSAKRAHCIHVEADEQHIGAHLRTGHGVLALATAQIQHHMREQPIANRPARGPRSPASGPCGAIAANPIAALPKAIRKREPFMQSGSSRAHALPFRARNGFRAIYLNSPAKQTLRGCDLTCWADGAAAMTHYARVRISSHTFAMKSAVSNGCVSLERSRTAMLPSSASFSPTTII